MIKPIATIIACFVLSCTSPGTTAQVLPGQYREPFAESFPVRKQQHLQLKAYIDGLVSGAREKSLTRFNPDYSSVKQYQKSVIPFRKQLAESFGYPPPLSTEGSVSRMVTVGEDSVCTIYRIWISVAEGFEAYGLYMVPHKIDDKAPLLICQHGGGGNPEAICDLDTRVNYHSFGHEAVKRGYIVWAPGLIMRCGYANDPPVEGAERGWLDRRLKMLGTSIIGVELQMIIESTKTLVRDRPEIDETRIGMTGLSWGGFYTLHAAALYPEIKVAVPSGSFRGHEVILDGIDDPDNRSGRYDFSMFGNAQVAGMICPRPLMVQMGMEDTLFDIKEVRKEVKKAADTYDRLGVGDLFRYSEHPGGHVFENESIFKFFKEHL
jgi:dienelactone hydrolase